MASGVTKTVGPKARTSVATCSIEISLQSGPSRETWGLLSVMRSKHNGLYHIYTFGLLRLLYC